MKKITMTIMAIILTASCKPRLSSSFIKDAVPVGEMRSFEQLQNILDSRILDSSLENMLRESSAAELLQENLGVYVIYHNKSIYRQAEPNPVNIGAYFYLMSKLSEHLSFIPFQKESDFNSFESEDLQSENNSDEVVTSEIPYEDEIPTDFYVSNFDDGFVEKVKRLSPKAESRPSRDDYYAVWFAILQYDAEQADFQKMMASISRGNDIGKPNRKMIEKFMIGTLMNPGLILKR